MLHSPTAPNIYHVLWSVGECSLAPDVRTQYELVCREQCYFSKHAPLIIVPTIPRCMAVLSYTPWNHFQNLDLPNSFVGRNYNLSRLFRYKGWSFTMYLDQAAAPLVSVATCVAGRMSTPRWNLLLVAHTRLARVLVLFYWKPRRQKLIAKPPCCKPTLATQSWNFLIVKRKWHFNRCFLQYDHITHLTVKRKFQTFWPSQVVNPLSFSIWRSKMEHHDTAKWCTKGFLKTLWAP